MSSDSRTDTHLSSQSSCSMPKAYTASSQKWSSTWESKDEISYLQLRPTSKRTSFLHWNFIEYINHKSGEAHRPRSSWLPQNKLNDIFVNCLSQLTLLWHIFSYWTSNYLFWFLFVGVCMYSSFIYFFVCFLFAWKRHKEIEYNVGRVGLLGDLAGTGGMNNHDQSIL